MYEDYAVKFLGGKTAVINSYRGQTSGKGPNFGHFSSENDLKCPKLGLFPEVWPL